MKIITSRYALFYEDIEMLYTYRTANDHLYFILQHNRYSSELDLHNRIIAADDSIISMLMHLDIMNVKFSQPIVMYEYDRQYLADGDVELIDEFCKRHNTEFHIIRLI